MQTEIFKSEKSVCHYIKRGLQNVFIKHFGRYNNTPHNDRLCRFCDLNEVGDEHHFLMSCKNIKLLSLRSKFSEDVYKINSSFKLFSLEELFMYIVAMKDESIMKLVAKFCFEVLTTFDSLLE